MSKYNVETLTNIVLDLVGDIGIHGETNSDNISAKNNDTMGELLYALVQEYSRSVHSCYNDYRGSMKSLARQKFGHLESIHEELTSLVNEIKEEVK